MIEKYIRIYIHFGYMYLNFRAVKLDNKNI
jgi:hypothetical protein